jgi:hypothetical protein
VDIRELLDDHVLACVDRQLAFTDFVGTAAYAVDLQQGTVTFTGGPTLRVGLLGSAAPGPRSWLWGWANPGGYPAPVLEAVESVRTFGEARGIRELVVPEVPLDDDWDATRAAIASVAASAVQVYLPVEAGGGTHVMLGVHDVPELPAPHPEPTRLAPTLNQALFLGMITDWPRALRAYAGFRGGDLVERDGAYVLTPAGGDSGATIEIDELGRLKSFSLTRSAAPRKGLGRLFGR